MIFIGLDCDGVVQVVLYVEHIGIVQVVLYVEHIGIVQGVPFILWIVLMHDFACDITT